MVVLKAIAEASGEALEYALFELNLYHGCPHGCAYGHSGTCYVPGTKHVSGETFKANRNEIKKVTLKNLEQDLKNWQGEKSIVHLCFLCDAYPIGWNTNKTRKCLELFRKYDHPFQVLTKGGLGACKDFDIYGPNDKFGVTLTCDNDADSLKWEPGAALPADRIDSLKVAHDKGIKTWVSLEPVLDPNQTLHLIDLTHEFVDHYGVGKLNHNKEKEKTIDWQKFREDAEAKLKGYSKSYMIKAALKEATPNFDESEETLIKEHDKKYQAAMDQLSGESESKDVGETKKDKKIPESALKIETKAKIIAEKGDVIKFLVNQAHKNHKGDTNAIKILYTSIASTNSGTSAGIQPGLNGDPGIGKTDAAKAVAHTIPSEWKKVATLTAMAIYYANIKPGTIILSDDVDWSGGLIGTMKRSMGDFQNPQEKMNVSANREGTNQFIPERLDWWVTCVDSVANDQLKDRQYSLDVDEEMEHKKVVSKYTGERRSIKRVRYSVDLGIEIARWIIKDIKDHELFNVVIDCAAAADWKLVENHRAQNKFWDLVEAFAILRYRQRVIDEDGWLHATVEDFKDAKDLFEKSKDSHRSNLTKPQMNVIESIIKLQKNHDGASQAMIAEDINRSIMAVSTALKAIEANTRFVVHERGEDGEQRYRCTIKDFDKFYLNSCNEIVSLKDDYQDTFIKCAA